MASRALSKVHPAVQKFLDHGVDFCPGRHRRRTRRQDERPHPAGPADAADIERQVLARDAQLDNDYGKDAQIAAIAPRATTLPTRSPSEPTRSSRSPIPSTAPRRRPPQRPLPQDTRWPPHRSLRPRPGAPTAHPSPARMPRARSAGSAAAACMGTARPGGHFRRRLPLHWAGRGSSGGRGDRLSLPRGIPAGLRLEVLAGAAVG